MQVENNIISVRTAIVCDEMRREDNGKEILIGVYSADIVPLIMPATLGLSFWVPIDIKQKGSTTVYFRIKWADGSVIHTLPPLPIHAQADDATVSVGLGPMPIYITKAGRLELEIKLDQNEWTLLRSIQVKANQQAK